MKATELMLGDWVTFKDCKTDEIVPIRIYGIHNDEECCALTPGHITDDGKGLDLLDIKDLAGIPLTAEILEKNGFEKAMTKYNDIECKYVSSAGIDCLENLLKDIYPTVNHKFENIEVKIPNNYDAVLTKNYGDYMTLPPVEKRRSHFPVEFNLGDE